MSYPFTEVSVILSAPGEAGVYALHGLHVMNSRRACIYVGETKDIRAQLIQHLREEDPCLAMFRACTFSYELVVPPALPLRWAEMVREFGPVCNRRWA